MHMQAVEGTQEAKMCSSLQGVSLLRGTLSGFDASPQTVRTLNQSQCTSEPVATAYSSPKDSSTIEADLTLDEVLMAYSQGRTVYYDKAEAVRKLRHRFCHESMPDNYTALPRHSQPMAYCAMHMRQDGVSKHANPVSYTHLTLPTICSV